MFRLSAFDLDYGTYNKHFEQKQTRITYALAIDNFCQNETLPIKDPVQKTQFTSFDWKNMINTRCNNIPSEVFHRKRPKRQSALPNYNQRMRCKIHQSENIQ